MARMKRARKATATVPRWRVFEQDRDTLIIDMGKQYDDSWINFQRQPDGSVVVDHAACSCDVVLDAAAFRLIAEWHSRAGNAKKRSRK